MIYLKYITAGHVAMVVCCLFYAVWWYIAYQPNVTASVLNGKAGIFFGLTLAFGIIGIYLNIYGIRHFSVSNWIYQICFFGCTAYFILLAITFLIFHRPVTSELLLIVAWATLEIATIFSVYHENILNGQLPKISLEIVAIATIISLVAYLLYYNVDEWTAFYIGIVPLIADAIGTAIILMLIIF